MTKKKVLIGSLELNGNFIRGGVYRETEDNRMIDIRYVGGYTSEMKNETVQEFLFRIYDESTGSLVTEDFNRN